MSLSKENPRENCCTLCQNHGKNVAKKGHKDCCPFENNAHIQDCDQCRTSKKNQRLLTEMMKSKRQAMHGTTPNTQTDERQRPMCQKCKNHGIRSLTKDHSKICQFRNCLCEKCCLTGKQMKANSESIKNRRMNLKRVKDLCSRTSPDDNEPSNANIDDDTNLSDSGLGSSLVADSPDTSVNSDGLQESATSTINPKLDADHCVVGRVCEPDDVEVATIAGDYYDYDPDWKFDGIDSACEPDYSLDFVEPSKFF